MKIRTKVSINNIHWQWMNLYNSLPMYIINELILTSVYSEEETLN